MLHSLFQLRQICTALDDKLDAENIFEKRIIILFRSDIQAAEIQVLPVFEVAIWNFHFRLRRTSLRIKPIKNTAQTKNSNRI